MLRIALILLLAVHAVDGFSAGMPTFGKTILRSKGGLEGFALHAFSKPRRAKSPFSRSLRLGGGPAAPVPTVPDHKVVSLLADCKGWGLARFISVNSAGSVLETAARMDLSMTGFNVPGKGEYLTIATDDKLFEAHINLEKVESVTFSQEAAKVGGHMLHVMRLKGADGILLSIMLQYNVDKGAGQYFEGAVEAFEKTMKKYGPETTFD